MTAFVVATLRAHHYLSTPEPRILDDSLAMPLAGLSSAAEASARVQGVIDRLAEHCDRADAITAVHRMTMVTCGRSRFMEDQLAAARARGVEQLVILGAGLDSTAYRDLAVTRGLALFEVDYPATQAWKRERLASLGVAIPESLAFVPFDFERQTLAEALAEGGVSPERMSFFSWLGVQPYLTDPTVMATLDTVAGFPAGSELVLDLATPNPDRRAVDEASSRAVAQAGEPYRTAYEPEVFAARLAERGFGEVEMIWLDAWLDREAARFNGRLAIPRRNMLVSAKVG